jgi:hypothetical protein
MLFRGLDGLEIRVHLSFTGTNLKSAATMKRENRINSLFEMATRSFWLAIAIPGILGPPHDANAGNVAAKQAQSFVSSIGVAGHLGEDVYSTSFTPLMQEMSNIGISNFRSCGTTPTLISQTQTIYNTYGIRTIVTMNPPTGILPNSTYWSGVTASETYPIVSYINALGPQVVAAIEMDNEIDNSYIYPNYQWYVGGVLGHLNNTSSSPYYWGKYIKAAIQDTGTALLANPATPNIPLMGPSLLTASDYSYVGNQSSYINMSNMHPYLDGYNPETIGWGSYYTGRYGLSDYKYGSIAGYTCQYCGWLQAPNEGWGTTEGGNSTATIVTGSSSTYGNWPITAHGKYIPRFYLTAFNHGSTLTCTYELIDTGTDPTNSQENYGLLYNNLSEKPAATALRNLISVLKDPGPPFVPQGLGYSLSGATTNVNSTLLQKRDGSFDLCLWLGVPCYNSPTGTSITVSSQNVTLNLTTPIASGTIYTLSDSGSQTATTATVTGTSGSQNISLAVDDHVMVVKLVPPSRDSLPLGGLELPRWAWSATASLSGSTAGYALDGENKGDTWSTGANQTSGQSYQMDFCSPQFFDSIAMDCPANDYPRGWAVYATNTPSQWGNPILTGSSTNPYTVINLNYEALARYLEIVQTGTASYPWTMNAIHFYAANFAANALYGSPVFARSGNTVTIVMQSYPGQGYQLQSAANLATWQSIGVSQQGTGSTLSLTDTNAISSRMFYRTVVRP